MSVTMQLKHRLERLPLVVTVLIARVILWVVNRGPFFPPFGGSRR